MNSRILLVEDDVRLAEMLCEYLGEMHFQVDVAGTGAVALTRLAEGSFDLVVLDLMLPDLDGLEVLPSLASSQRCTTVDADRSWRCY